MLDRDENMVLTQEELEGIKNELKQKDTIIAELNSDMEVLAKELDGQSSPKQSEGEKQDLKEEVSILMEDLMVKEGTIEGLTKTVEEGNEELLILRG